MTDFDKYCMSFHLHNALKCIADGKHDLATHNVDQAVKIMDRSGEMKELTNLELIEQLKKVTIELENREYLKGIRFNPAKVAQPVFKKKSANELRFELIQRAREFVEIQKNSAKTGCCVYKGTYTCKPNFIVNTEKRTAVCLLKGAYSETLYSKGIAKCNPSDVFNADIGKAIALARALGIEIPIEFIEVVQPIEFAVGQVVKWGTNKIEYQRITEIEHDKARCVDVNNGVREFHWLYRISDGTCTIIDDTNAIYESAGE